MGYVFRVPSLMESCTRSEQNESVRVQELCELGNSNGIVFCGHTFRVHCVGTRNRKGGEYYKILVMLFNIMLFYLLSLTFRNFAVEIW